MRHLVGGLAVLALAGCTVPYQPLEQEIELLPTDAFDRVAETVRAVYPRLSVLDRETFRIQSAWLPFDDRRAGERRATVYLEGDRTLSVVVETRYLRVGFWSGPKWSSPRGDARLERELMAALVAVLEA